MRYILGYKTHDSDDLIIIPLESVWGLDKLREEIDKVPYFKEVVELREDKPEEPQ